MPPGSTLLGASHISRLQALSPCGARAVNGLALTMLPCSPKRRPLPSLNQLTSFRGARNGHSPAPRIPNRTQAQIARNSIVGILKLFRTHSLTDFSFLVKESH